jgi:anthranilate phosphoribosyltransferase
LRGAESTRWLLDPADYGFTGLKASELAGGAPEENAALIVQVLAGSGPAAAEAAVLLNAAGAIYVSGKAKTFAKAIDAAQAALKSGKGTSALAALRKAAPHG